MTPTDSGASPCLRVGSGTDATAVRRAAEDAGGVAVQPAGPTGVQALDPLVLATLDGRTAFHAKASPDEAAVLAKTLAGGTLPTEDAVAVVEHDPDTGRLPLPEDGPLSVGRRTVLARAGWVDSTATADLSAPATSAATENPAAFHARIADLGLLGRGRGDEQADTPVADAWKTAREAAGDPVVVVNANESDPAVVGDSLLLTSDPAAVLDGALAVAHAVDATDVVVYCSETDERAREGARAAATGLADEGPAIEVVTGPDQFTAGEPTMAIESMEGNDRLEARRRPPGPAEHGLYGRPTVVHTPRTLVQVRHAVVAPEDFDADDADPGTRLVTVGGDVAAPATVELPTGTSLGAVREAVETSGRVKMACVGGQFGGLTRDLDTAASAPALAGAGLGTAGAVELFGEGRCPVATAGTRAKFACEENCGRCVPCREGSKQATDLLRDVYDGEFAAGKLRELGRVMRETSLCAFGRDAARPMTTAMSEFEAEFRAHAEGRCPSGACEVEG